MIRLIVGLGNPGKEYEKTRHNVGVWFVQTLCQLHKVDLMPRSTLCGNYGQWYLNELLSIRLGIPTTFMDDSGRAVSVVMRYYKILPKEILIVHDELDFTPGVARFKWGGGSGGHNGLKDIIQALGTPNFWRLRFGIGHPGEKTMVPYYVLKVPQLVDYQRICRAIQNSLSVLEAFCMNHTQQAMHSLHQLCVPERD